MTLLCRITGSNLQHQEYISRKGFSFLFDPSACEECEGNCCRLESGYIWIKKGDIFRISRYLGIDTDHFIREYLVKIGRRFSLKEIQYKEEFPCVFFDMKEKKCLIYPVRPTQCRTYPFWNEFMNSDDDEREFPENCPGIRKKITEYR
jgi:Fe-S-cluster containining protein